MTPRASVGLPYAITVGGPKNNSRGQYCPCEPSVSAVADMLRNQPKFIERWWSPHLWRNNHRTQNNWLASIGVSTDIDYKVDGQAPPSEVTAELERAAREGELPCSIFHLTPHGARMIWLYPSACNDRTLQQRAERGAAALAMRALERLKLSDHYAVDPNPTGDLARFFYTPDANVKGIERHNEVIELNDKLTNPVDLSGSAPADVAPPKTERPIVKLSTDYAEALKKWNADHPGDWPKNSGPCPACGDDHSFGRLPEDPQRWCCFSTDHEEVGHKGERVWWGDALDLEAHRRNCRHIDVLRQDGYLAAIHRVEPPPRTLADMPPDVTDGTSETAQTGGGPPSNEEPAGVWRSRSYKTAVEIIEKNARNVLDGRKLELNEMTGDIELARRPIRDADAHRIRYLIELRFSGGKDKKGNQVGLQLASADVFAAIAQVAHARPYHPVRDYLNTLKWDGQTRIDLLLDLLGADKSRINRAMVKRFLISGVARPMKPGCKVDTIFVLQGEMGYFKSGLFRVLSSPWFIDTPIDFRADPVRAYMTMRKAWLLEWAELESMFRARSASTVNAFVTSSIDSYVPKHARYSIDVPRGGIIVATINPDEFLSDPDGHRRFWPMKVTKRIDLEQIEKLRDQIWAEAKHYYDAGEPWWLDAEEEALLAPRHETHTTTDAWATPVLEYVAERDVVAVREILGEGLCIPKEHWDDRSSKRVQRILKSSGEWKPDPNKPTRGAPRLWRRIGTLGRKLG